MKRIPTSLVSAATNEPVEAYLIDGVTYDLLEATELAWAIPRFELAKKIAANGGSAPQHWHWDWRRKSSKISLLAYRCFGIECGGEIQGLMSIDLVNQTSRLAGQLGKPLAYVDYIESAPWNIKTPFQQPVYKVIGTRLIEAAVRLSLEEEFGGRVGLHSLSQAENFYEKTCGMIRGELDPQYESLRWFEFTSENAKQFLGDTL